MARGRQARRLGRLSSLAVAVLLCVAVPLSAQQTGTGSSTVADGARPALAIGALPDGLRLDGRLDEPVWAAAQRIESLTMIEPVEGGPLVCTTEVWVVADPHHIVIGVLARDPDPSGIVSFSVIRDPHLRNEDHVKIVLDPFLDGRSGYVFAVNPSGARFDALVARRGEGEDARWDAVWEAATARGDYGWSVEMRIPLKSLTFDAGLDEWGFNIERRTERIQEVSRWASPIRDAKITQTSRAGRITQLPRFETGLGLAVRPAMVGGFEKPDPETDREGTFEPSLDVAKRIGSSVTAIGTLNTDFAETEVDTRRTNLTRFSVFFPEKRTFFLEGSDIFDFGIGLVTFRNPDIVPFFSRQIGLYEGEQVPIIVGGKLNGKVGDSNFGALVTHTGRVEDLVEPTTMGAARFRQNILEESSAGVIATVGDPEGRADSYLLGADFTFQTSRLAGDKNFLVGVWGMVTDREGLTGDRTAFGGKIDYPNDTWDVALTYKRIGDGFDPSLGFVPRRGIHKVDGGVNFRVRPGWPWLRLMYYELRPAYVTDLKGRWESYRVFTAPINWRFESGDRFEFNIVPTGERLVEDFEIADGVVIPPGEYHWVRYRIEADFAAKRLVSGRVSWWFGDFYDGTLDQIRVGLDIKPWRLLTGELSLVRNTGRLPAGPFVQEVYGVRLRLNFSPDLQLSSFVQYDNESREVGANTRLRWTFWPVGDLYVVYNHNVIDEATGWELDSNQLLIKVQYAFRY